MERRGSNTWLVAVLAIAVGFLAALLILGSNDSKNSSATVSNGTTAGTTGATTTSGTSPGTTAGTTTTSTTDTTATPQSPAASIPACVSLWNQPTNRGAQVFLVNVASQQPVRVHVGVTTDVPPECLVTIVANNGDAYTFPEGGGSTYPYAPAPGTTSASSLPAAQKISNALEQRDGTLTEH
jgi:hypothetical protein